jgi:serine/threonine-protein kinase
VTGGRVVLKTSRGTQVMPSVVGLLEQDATARLRQLGFVVTAPQSVPSNVPAGQVTDQSVPKGTEWPVSGSVTLTLSSGPPLKAVPDVRFQYTPDQAKAVLANAGFKLGNQGSEYSGSVAQGNIIRQNPAAGAQAPAGSAVTVVVSLGSPNVSVPDVSTMTQSAATSTLTNGGLRIVIGAPVAVSDPAQDGIVQQQSPTAGQRVKRGSPVTVNLGQYTAPATTATTATTSTTPTTP